MWTCRTCGEYGKLLQNINKNVNGRDRLGDQDVNADMILKLIR
jgi:hypothetical protein